MTKILLVEDDKSLREIYGVRLLAEGYDIVSAGDGEEALAMAIKERPSLIVSDVMMPKISGFDMLDILRSTTETKDIKVIMMTALSSEDQRQRGERLGADRYLVKSQVGIEDVVRTVHDVLGDVPGSVPAAPTPHVAPVATPLSPTPQPAPTLQPITPTQPVAPTHIPERPSVASLSPQAQQPTPQPAPTLQPITPTQPTTADNPLPSPSGGLPQPTAPFSSPAPRPSNLGDRVIHPIDIPASDQSPDLAQLMEQELSSTGLAPISVTTTPAPEPAPVAPQPVQPTPEPQMGQQEQPAPPIQVAPDQSQNQSVSSPFPPIPPQQQ